MYNSHDIMLMRIFRFRQEAHNKRKFFERLHEAQSKFPSLRNGENKEKRKEGVWMKKYSFPAVEIFEIPAEDVIATSGGSSESNSLTEVKGNLEQANITSWGAGTVS